ncbi:hypothetical protein [Saccharopolyspora phatthalungensis]|uniref:Uncharacterized protein n=1 Tax=Saccharopolyspora phatthalungensis TaxID=664693 RepID=A0A840QB66_9PSEU|nr:hypothetical protein [Saccharopolyspora phatthalungensis]MBB5157050.1 hypothetical protein [Saccharopolyspora phatthalungensis]
MDSRIDSLHCEYVVGQRDSAAARAFDQIAHTTLPDALDTALDTALTALTGVGEAVYVCRDIRSDCVLDPDTPDLARRWAEALAAAITRAIADEGQDGTNVMRFVDQADYTARYLADHVHGRAVGRWYYRPLAPSGHRPPAVTVLDAIRGPSAGPVLAALYRQGTLPDVLSVLDDDAHAAVVEQWCLPTDAKPAAKQPLRPAAVRIADNRTLWTFEVVLPEDIVRRLGHWRSSSALADAVVSVLRQLGLRDLLRRIGTVLPEAALARVPWELNRLGVPRFDRWLSDAALSVAASYWPFGVAGSWQFSRLVMELNLVFPRETPRRDWRLSLISMPEYHLSTVANLVQGWLAALTARLGGTPVLLGFGAALAVDMAADRDHQTASGAGALSTAKNVPPVPENVPSAPEEVPSALENVQSVLESVPPVPESMPPAPEKVPSAPEGVMREAESVPSAVGDVTSSLLIPDFTGFRPAVVPANQDHPIGGAIRPELGGETLGTVLAFSADHGVPLLHPGSIARAQDSVFAEWRVAMAHRLGGVPVELGRATPAPATPTLATPTSATPTPAKSAPATPTPAAGPPAVKVRDAARRLLTDAPGALELGQRIGAAGPGHYSTVLLTAALIAEHPDWAGEPTVMQVVTDAVAAWRNPDGSAESDGLARVLAMTAVNRLDEIVTSPNAGVLLLLRAVSDLRLPALLTRAGFADGLSATLLAVATRLTGANTSDPAAHVFAGLPEQSPDTLLELWRQADGDRCAKVRDAVTLAAQAQRITLDGDPADALPDGLLGVPSADATVGLVAVAVLRAWSRWLGQFAESSAGYLAGHFLCRAGTVRLTEKEVVVELTGGPLDVILHLAGHDAPIAAVPWLGRRSVTYRIGAR